MADKDIKEGDEASWQWSGGRPGGKVAEVKEHGEIAIQSKKGNTIKKNADPEDPAVHLSRPGNDVVKRAHELDVDKEGPNHGDGGDKKEDGPSDEAQTGDKREASEHEPEEDKGAKKQKTGKGKAAPKATPKPKPAPKAAGKKNGAAAKKDAAEKEAPAQKAEDKAEEKAEEKVEEKPEAEEPAATDDEPKKKGRGRPKKDSSAASAPKKASGEKKTTKKAKTPTAPNGEGIGSRTRSKKT